MRLLELDELNKYLDKIRESTKATIDDSSCILSRYTFYTGGRKINNKILHCNCKNCGAPLKTNECEYCGTRY